MSAGCQGSSIIANTSRPREHGRDEQQPAPAQVDLGVVAVLDLDRAVAPAHVAVQPGEDLDRPARGQPPRAVDDVGLEHGADRRPPRLDRALPVGPHDRDEAVEARAGSSSSGRTTAGTSSPRSASRPRARPARAASRGRARARRRVRQRGRGRRGDEVGHEAELRRSRWPASRASTSPARRDTRARRRPTGGAAAPGRAPQHVRAPHDLEQRRDREPGAQEVVLAEAVADHGADSLTHDSGTSESVGARAGGDHSPGMLRSVLTTPGVARVFGASLVGRIPAGALGLLLILRVGEVGGGYGGGGLAAGAFALGLAAAAPLVGRIVDVRGQTGVLAACTAAVSGRARRARARPRRDAARGAARARGVAGGAHPAARRLPARAVADAARRTRRGGTRRTRSSPPRSRSPTSSARSSSSARSRRARRPRRSRPARRCCSSARRRSPSPRPRAPGRRCPASAAASPARSPRPGVRTLLSVQALVGVSFGAIEVATVAFAAGRGREGRDRPAARRVGPREHARRRARRPRRRPRDPVRRLVVLLAALAAGDALLVAATGPLALGGASRRRRAGDRAGVRRRLRGRRRGGARPARSPRPSRG